MNVGGDPTAGSRATPPGAELRIWGVRGLPEVRAGDDLGALIAAAEPGLADGDVVVVTSKVVSKAEGRFTTCDREQAIESETVRVVAERAQTRIVATRHGFVLAAAGVDASNVPAGQVLLLPHDPDASAREIRTRLAQLTGKDVGVIVSDTFGRPWRQGLTDVALGVAGLPPLEDLRGRNDTFGRRLDATITAVADEIAAAAELVKGKLSAVPVAVVRGLPGVGGPDGPGGRALIRPPAEDMFSLGTAEAARAAVRASAETVAFDSQPVPQHLVDRALAAARESPWAGWRASQASPAQREQIGAAEPALMAAPELLVVSVEEATAASLAAAGAAAATIRLALAAEGLGSFWRPAPGSPEPLGLSGALVGVIGCGFPAPKN